MESPSGSFDLPKLPPAFEALLLQLPRATEDALRAASEMGPESIAVLRALAHLQVLDDCLVADSGRCLVAARRPALEPRDCGPGAVLSVPEDVFIRPAGGGWRVFRPGRPTVVHAEADAGVVERLAEVKVDALGVIERFLFDNGVLVEAAAESRTGWEFHDALFHSVSVHGDASEGSYGAMEDVWPAPASVRERLGLVEAADAPFDVAATASLPPLDAVLADRRSCRSFDAAPVPGSALGELLRLALATRSSPPNAPNSAAFHAYPSGGGRDELVAVVAQTAGRGSVGVYLHDEHRLAVVKGAAERGADVVETLSRPCGIAVPLPSVALVFAAEYERVASKYAAIAYATILRNVGAVYQTVSLVASALGLGTCAVGGGWGRLERDTLADVLGGRPIVGAMVIGIPAGRP